MPQTVLVKENTELVVLLLSKSGAILNAEKCPISMEKPEATGISQLTMDNGQLSMDNCGAVYDLQGRMVSRGNVTMDNGQLTIDNYGSAFAPLMKKGVYIMNGRKVIVR